MQYLSIEYKIRNLTPNGIKNIEEYLLKFEKEYFDRFKLKYPDYILSQFSVVLSDNIWRDIEVFYNENGNILEKLRPKGLDHLMNIVTINGITKYFWAVKYFNDTGIKIFFNLLIENLISNDLEEQYSIDKALPLDNGIDFLCEKLIKIWLVHQISKKTALVITESVDIEYDNMEDLTFAFKRNIKQFHFNYQKDLDGYKFLIASILEFELFIRRILSYKTENNLKGLAEFEQEIISIISTLELLDLDLDNCDFDFIKIIKNSIIDILKKCDIEIYENPDSKDIDFRIVHGPKKLFPGLIDTHPRLICFIDILGFKALIEEYETENTSMVLKQLKTAFDDSSTVAFKMVTGLLSDESKDEIEFKMFSDCITISIPYIEFGIDLKHSFFITVIILNIFQQTFMKAGFYLRGHVTIGSYYSDSNMLFSGGLVEAYKNESATVYPAISVNTKLIDKLLLKSEYDESLPSFNTIIISHNFGNLQQNKIINPFYTLDAYKTIDEQFNKLINQSLGKEFEELEINISFKKIFQEALVKQGINDLEAEIEVDKVKIVEKLEENYEHHFEIYQDMDKDHSERVLASQVIEKYKFLFSLFDWLSHSSDDRFSFLEIR